MPEFRDLGVVRSLDGSPEILGVGDSRGVSEYLFGDPYLFAYRDPTYAAPPEQRDESDHEHVTRRFQRQIGVLRSLKGTLKLKEEFQSPTAPTPTIEYDYN